MKKIFLTLMLAISASSLAGSVANSGDCLTNETTGHVIAHINGMMVNFDGAHGNWVALRDRMKGFNAPAFNPAGETVEAPPKFVLFYNHSYQGLAGFSNDMVENIMLSLRSKFPDISYLKVWDIVNLINRPNRNVYSVMTPDLLKAIREEISQQFFTKTNFDIMQSDNHRTFEIMLNQSRAILMQGRALTLVTHSQGNFYGNEVFKALTKEVKSGNVPFSEQQFNIAHFATPTAAIGRPIPGPYGNNVTLDDDTAMNLTRAATGLIFDVPQPTYIRNHPDPADYRVIDAGEAVLGINEFRKNMFAGHSFSGVYFGTYDSRAQRYAAELRDAYFPAHYQLGETFDIAKISTSVVKKAVLTSSPIHNNSGPILATLIWNKNGDIDLHTTEPDGNMVFFNKKKGNYGSLDWDDRYNKGPEHYTSTCEALREGTFTFGVNYYKDHYGSGPIKATLAISAFGKAYLPVDINLTQERGDAGAGSPINLYRVTIKSNPQRPGQWLVDTQILAGTHSVDSRSNTKIPSFKDK